MKTLGIVAFAVTCGFANAAPWVAVAVDNATEGMWLYDPTNMAAAPTQVMLGVACWGLAGNDDDQVLYANNGGTLYTYQYGTWLQTHSVAMTQPSGSINFVGLAYDDVNNKLYGVRNIATEALYEIDPVTGVTTQLWPYTAGDYDFGGFDWNPGDGKLWALSDDTTPASGIYTIDAGTQAINFIASYPTGETDVDGLAIGGGKAYLIEDDSVGLNGRLYEFDIATGVYVANYPLPWTASRTFSAGAYLNVNAGNAISGVVTLNDFTLDELGQSVTFEIDSSGTIVDTENVSLGAGGAYSFNTTQLGTFDIYCKASHWLRKVVSGVGITGPVTGLNFDLINGDVDGDNEVGPGDFGALSAAFGSVDGDSNWNPMADLDGDGEVGPSDFGVLSANFGISGD